MALRFNAEKSQRKDTNTIEIAIDGDSYEELSESNQAREMAMQAAAQNGYGNAGVSGYTTPSPISTETGDILDGAEAFDPSRPRQGWRVIFTIVKRL